MLNNLLLIDTKLTDFFREFIPHNYYLNLIFSFFSIIGNSAIVWIVIMLLLVIFEEKRNRQFIIYFLASLLTTTFLVNIVIKNIVQRPRPFLTDSITSTPLSVNQFQLIQPVLTCPIDFSFPSGHAAGSFAAAVILSVFDKKRKLFYYIVAILISYSRIYLGCHYFFDVFFGALIGSLISSILIKIKYALTSSR